MAKANEVSRVLAGQGDQRVSNHRAGGPAHRVRPPLTTGRLALWLGFWLIIALLFMSTVITIAGKGGQ